MPQNVLFTLFQVSDPDHDMAVTHMHYTAWPVHGVPENAMSVISFICHVCREHPHCLDQPLLVHCSASVGRTGTFILLDTVMQQMKNEGTLNIYNILQNVRDQRMKMVQTKVTRIATYNAYSLVSNVVSTRAMVTAQLMCNNTVFFSEHGVL